MGRENMGKIIIKGGKIVEDEKREKKEKKEKG